MQDYRKWPEKPVSVTSLSLDPQNPRIPSANRKVKERELIAQLITYDKVYELAQAIAEQGYFPTEILIGIEESGKKVILEGNRRLAALKLLISPSIAPKEQQKRFERLSKQVAPEVISKVRVSFAPSREDAAPIIVRRHTASNVEKWKPAQQGQYVRSFVRGDISLEDLGKRLGLSKGDIQSMLRYDTLYEVAQTLSLSPAAKKVVSDPRAFSFSTLSRLIDNPKVPQFLGISFTEDGSFKGKIDRSEFQKGLARIVSDVATKAIDSRSLNSDQQIQEYLEGLSDDTPNLKKKGTFSSSEYIAKTVRAEEEESTKETPRKAVRQSKGLVPASVSSQLSLPRINEILREMKGLSWKEFPNSSAVMFRVLLDVLVSHYMDTTEKIKPILERERSKHRGNEWYPTLRQLLKELINDPNPPFRLNPQARKMMKQVLEDDRGLFSISHMDQFVHNKFASPSDDQLRKLWAVWEELITRLLVEYPPSPVSK